MVRFFYYYDIRASFAYILLKLNYIPNYDIIIMFFQHKILKYWVPDLMFPKVHLDVISLRPGLPRLHYCSNRISKTDEDMTIKDWKKCMVNHRELLGSNIVRRIRIEDRIISILHNGQSWPILFYAILP